MNREQQRHPPLRATLRTCLIVLTVQSVIGCESSPQAASESSGGEAGWELRRLSTAERSRRLLLGSEVGLEVREWIVEADRDTIARAMVAFRADVGEESLETIIDDDLAQRLRMNGLRAVPVRVEDLPLLEAELGYTTLNRRGWYGQLAEWMPLHGQRAGGPDRAVFIDGRPRRFDSGEYRLMGRAWVLPMEDGPRLNLQIVPEYQPPQRDSLRHLLARPTHDGTLQGEPITSITLDLLIKPGFALILTGEQPSVEWWETGTDGSGLGRDNRLDDENRQKEADDDENRDAASGQGRSYLGPYVGLPPTLGEMLFDLGGVRGGRGMLIFIPRVPEELVTSTTATVRVDEQRKR